MDFSLFTNLSMSVGLSYSQYQSSLDNKTLLEDFTGNKQDIISNKLLGFLSSVTFDSRYNAGNAYSGFYLSVNGSVYPAISGSYNRVYDAGFDSRTYLTANTFTDITLALRAGGEKVWEDFPYYKAAFLGGREKLRGYSNNRFSGDASIFCQAELRAFITEAKLVLRGKIGVFGFAETGRVFVESESSSKWHPAYGGGVWVSYLDRMLNLSLSLAKSPERFTVGFKFDMAF
jgi:outer membrane protein assembly factor BamA